MWEKLILLTVATLGSQADSILEECTSKWQVYCGDRDLVAGIQGSVHNPRFRVKCCSHPALRDPAQYSVTYNKTLGNGLVFNATENNDKVDGRVVRYLANIKPSATSTKMVIGQLGCRTPRKEEPKESVKSEPADGGNAGSSGSGGSSGGSVGSSGGSGSSGGGSASSGGGSAGSSGGSAGGSGGTSSSGSGAVSGSMQAAAAGPPTCFPPSATLLVQDKGPTPLGQVQVGDFVASESWLEGREGFSQVVGFLHRQMGLETTFLRITTENGTRLEVSGNHLIFATTCPNDNETWGPGISNWLRGTDLWFVGGRMRVARRARVGHCVLSAQLTPERITDIAETLIAVDGRPGVGVIAPVTEAGTVVVSGVLGSCYCNIESHVLLHSFFYLSSYLSKLLGSLLGQAESQEPPPALFLFEKLLHHILPPPFNKIESF